MGVRRCFETLIILVFAAACCRPAAAQEFRIETEVFVGDAEEPTSRTTTLFESSAVYEFVDNPDQTIIYRAGAEGEPGVFILLDPATQRRTEIEVVRVERLMEKLSGWAAEQDDELLKFSANPKFRESYDEATGSLTLSNPEWTYRVATYKPQPLVPAALDRYRQFTDRYAQLTAMLHASPPPGPRLALNAALANHAVVPTEIQRTIGGDEDNVVRALHTFNWRLSREDRARLDAAQQQLANFQKVENDAFIAAVTARSEAIRGQSK
jgi:hypothetical protein